MVQYAAQDPIKMHYQRTQNMETGYNIDVFRRGGIVMVPNPTNSGTALASANYIVETLEGVVSGRQLVCQAATNTANGNEYTRYGDGNTWSNFTPRSTRGPGGSGNAVGVA